MFDEEFDNEDFLNPEFEAKLEAWRERMMLEAIEANYENLKENGVNHWHVRNMMPEEQTSLVRTFKTMLDHFEGEEEYEKCAEMVKYIKMVEDVMAEKV